MTPASWLALCGIAGPCAFVGAWLLAGLQEPDYEPLRDAISQLAREGAGTRPLMTAGFVAFGVLVPLWALLLRRVLGTGVAVAAAVAGLATLGVALLPLTAQGGQPQDLGHGIAAGTGYLAMAATPLLAVAPLRRLGHARAAATSTVVGVVSLIALVGSLLVVDRSGGLQRLGLTVVDAWHVVVAGWVLRRR